MIFKHTGLLKNISVCLLILILMLTASPVKMFAQYTQNYCASFNGANSYIAVPSHTEISPTAGITVEAWINPAALPSASACVIGKNYLNSYYFGIENTGRFIFYPKGSGLFLRSRVTGTVKPNQWTHIAATYDGTTTRLYLNGVFDTSRVGISGPLNTNFDSLFIGADRIPGSPAYFFNGKMDNVRIWGIARTASEILNHMFIPLNIYQLSGPYSYIAASYQFDNNARDYSGPAQNNGFARNITYINYTNKAVNHIDYNNNVVLNGTTDYCSHYNIGDIVNPTVAITLEAWVKRDTTISSPSAQNIVDKSGGTTRYNYSLFIFNTGQVVFGINDGSPNLQTGAILTGSQWTHLAATYNSLDGNANIYMNGNLVATSIFSGTPPPLINKNINDSVFIGGIGATSYASNRFRGQIDEVRIWRKVRTQQQIKDMMYTHPEAIAFQDSLVLFDFDYLQSGFKLDANYYNYGLRYIGNADINCAHYANSKLSSPMISDEDGMLPDSYTSNANRFFVPDANSTGVTDSIYISGVGPVNNLKMYLLMSHTYVQDMQIFLTSPSGMTITLLNTRGGNSNDVMTIFSDEADSNASSGFSALNGPGITPAFSPSIKPDQPLSSFNGQNRNGWWKLKLVDVAGGDIGYVHSWGLNMKSFKTLNLSALIQGFYNPATNKMRPDTVQVFLRIPLPPFPLVDSSKAVLDSNGFGKFIFNKVNSGYRVVKHRNSVETWSSSPSSFLGDTASYDFISSASQAYGNNEISVDNSPQKFAIYSCDVNQDGTVNLSDIVQVFNDAGSFTTGYTVSDVTGDDIVDLSDVTLTFNNSNAFVGIVRP